MIEKKTRFRLTTVREVDRAINHILHSEPDGAPWEALTYLYRVRGRLLRESMEELVDFGRLQSDG